MGLGAVFVGCGFLVLALFELGAASTYSMLKRCPTAQATSECYLMQQASVVDGTSRFWLRSLDVRVDGGPVRRIGLGGSDAAALYDYALQHRRVTLKIWQQKVTLIVAGPYSAGTDANPSGTLHGDVVTGATCIAVAMLVGGTLSLGWVHGQRPRTEPEEATIYHAVPSLYNALADGWVIAAVFWWMGSAVAASFTTGGACAAAAMVLWAARVRVLRHRSLRFTPEGVVYDDGHSATVVRWRRLRLRRWRGYSGRLETLDESVRIRLWAFLEFGRQEGLVETLEQRVHEVDAEPPRTGDWIASFRPLAQRWWARMRRR